MFSFWSVQMKSSQEDTIKYKQQVSDLEKKLSDARRGLSSRDALIKSLEDNVTDMDKKIEKVEVCVCVCACVFSGKMTAISTCYQLISGDCVRSKFNHKT